MDLDVPSEVLLELVRSSTSGTSKVFLSGVSGRVSCEV